MAVVACTLAAATSAAWASQVHQPLSVNPASLTDAETQRRTDFIEQRLEASRRHAHYWHYAWLGINLGPGLAVGSALAATAGDSGDQAAGIVQAGQAVVGIAYLYLDPVEARFGAGPLRALPDANREERVRKLQRAEQMLQENAARCAHRTSWRMHLGNAAMAIASGLVVWAAGSGEQGLITGASTLGGGEIQFWTLPSQPVRDLEDYERLISGTSATSRVNRVRLVPSPGGLAFSLSF